MPGPAKSFDESDVIDAAVKAFWHTGFEGTNLTAVLEEVGIGRQSLYNVFESKEALYIAALRRYRQENIGALVSMLDGGGPPVDRINAVFDDLEKSAQRANCGGCFIANAIAEFARSNPGVLKEVEQSCSELTDAFGRTLQEGVASGDFPASLVVEDVARLCTTLVEGVALLNRVQTGPEFAGSTRRALRSLLVGP